MKTTTTPLKAISFITAGTVALLAGCSKSSDRASSSTNSDTAAATSTSSPASGSTTTGSTGAGAGSTAATTTGSTGSSAMSTTQNVSWNQVKDLSYDQRNELATKANDYAAKLDRDATTAKGATAKHLADARDNLRSAASEISNATADTWSTTKQHVADAWQKAEAAYQNAAE